MQTCACTRRCCMQYMIVVYRRNSHAIRYLQMSVVYHSSIMNTFICSAYPGPTGCSILVLGRTQLIHSPSHHVGPIVHSGGTQMSLSIPEQFETVAFHVIGDFCNPVIAFWCSCCSMRTFVNLQIVSTCFLAKCFEIWTNSLVASTPPCFHKQVPKISTSNHPVKMVVPCFPGLWSHDDHTSTSGASVGGHSKCSWDALMLRHCFMFLWWINDACDPKNMSSLRLGQYEGELKRSLDHVTFIGSTV